MRQTQWRPRRRGALHSECSFRKYRVGHGVKTAAHDGKYRACYRQGRRDGEKCDTDEGKTEPGLIGERLSASGDEESGQENSYPRDECLDDQKGQAAIVPFLPLPGGRRFCHRPCWRPRVSCPLRPRASGNCTGPQVQGPTTRRRFRKFRNPRRRGGSVNSRPGGAFYTQTAGKNIRQADRFNRNPWRFPLNLMRYDATSSPASPQRAPSPADSRKCAGRSHRRD